MSPTCGNYDRESGKCINCIDNYEFYFGLCIPTKGCKDRQWSDNKGVCHDVNNRCDGFNPSTGDCTSCIKEYNYLNGICCVNGEFNVNGQCAKATDASAVQNNNGCSIWFNGIGCDRCDSGFKKTKDSVGFYYCQRL